MVNPYSCYILSFIIALIAYQFGWSELYPTLAWPLIIFILVTVLIHGVLSFYWQKSGSVKINRISPVFKPLYVTIFIFSLWLIEFIYAGGVPLFEILLSKPFDYRLFGVPSLHVFVVTFSSFYTIYLFQVYITEKKKSILFLYIINLLAAILIFNRGMFLFNLSGSLFIYLLTIPKPTFSKALIVLIALPVLFYFFGVLGNIRIASEAKRNYDADIFLSIGRASESFRSSIIPKEYFWAYIYVTSPLANLQTNVNHENDKPTGNEWLGFITNEFVFDFISKRTNQLLNIERVNDSRIEGPFNVSTVYSTSYSYCGWAGMQIMALFLLVLPLIYKNILGTTNEFMPTGVAILCALYLFLIFDNTVRFTGLGFQLVYPILFPFVGLAYKRFKQ